jgi:putative DNA primase/helicase
VTATLDSILTRLEGVKRRGAGWMACCPVHADKNASLSITEGEGKILLHDFGGCSTEAICTALGLEMADLFSTASGVGKSPCQACNTATLTLAQYADAKRLPLDFLRSLGLTDSRYCGETAVRIPYRDDRGVEVAVRYRLALSKSAGGDNRFRWKKDTRPQLYGLWRPLANDYVVLCEGESDCHTLWHHGFPALGVPGATNWNEKRDAVRLASVATIYVVVEPDSGGAAVKSWTAKSSLRDRARLLSLGPFKDPSALHIDDPTRFADRFREALTAAVPISSILAAEALNERANAWTLCRHLASADSIMEVFGEAIRTRGWWGNNALPSFCI